ncbi:MAG: outer membrane beta-barrel protein [Ignavibacteriales bacterium]|nr:outer membrane beta-barrel protein [Ignavibacteriales bacterium]
MRRFLFYLIPITLFRISHAVGEERKEYLFHPSSTLQDQPQNGQPESSKSSIYLQFNTSGLYPSLTDWKNQLHLSDGTHPSGTNIVFGAEAGWVINSYIQAAIGYEFFFTSKVSTIETTGDQINSTYFYGSLRGSIPLESIQNLSLFSSIDVGSLSATEVMENYYGQDFNKTGSTTAYRFMFGAQYFMTDNWSIMAGTGYFSGKINTVTVNGQTWPNFALDLSGFILRFAVNYHFQLF